MPQFEQPSLTAVLLTWMEPEPANLQLDVEDDGKADGGTTWMANAIGIAAMLHIMSNLGLEVDESLRMWEWFWTG